MPTLTDDLTAQLRGEIGDDGENFVISNFDLQAMYTRASGDYDVTLVYALRRMRAYYAKAVSTGKNDEAKRYNNALFEHYSMLLKDAERVAGMDQGKLGVGSFDLNLYEEDDDQGCS